MSSPPVQKSAVAIKGPRKRERSSSESSLEDFKGCRDSPSPIRGGPVHRATKSRKMHHKVEIETPLMHRHILEEYLEGLWESCGAEFKFVRSSHDQTDMDFYEGFPPDGPRTRGPAAGHVVRQVVPVPVSGSSITGETIFRVTASSSGQPGSSSSTLPSRPR